MVDIINQTEPSLNPVTDSPARTVQRVRHELKRRTLTVRRTALLSPHLLRITFTSPELQDFISLSFDDHVKLILPGEPPVMRDYTPRRFNGDELDIEFALHGHGPAATWATQAAPGQTVQIGGPRGSFVVPVDFDWHLLVGDLSALPAITRRLEELPAACTAIVRVLADAAEPRALPSRANVNLQWITADLPAAVQALTLPPGEGYAWAAGEASVTAAVRAVLVGTHGLPKERIRAAAYWKPGNAGHHENL